MKYGVAIRNMGPQSTRKTIRACAKIAEDAGLDALFVSDHLCIPPDQTEGSGGRYLDALATLAYLAGATLRIRLGVSVLVLPYRPAVLAAKQIATVQELSGERMILGVGVGWMKPEFDALGVDFSKRGALTTETLQVIRQCFDGSEAKAFEGSIIHYPPFVFQPKPKRPPIWIGGNGPNAIKRALEFGDGWHPMLKPADLGPAVAKLQAEAAARGRDRLEIIVRRGLRFDDPGAASRRVSHEIEAGATYFILDLGRYADENEFAKSIATFVLKIKV
jgi:probable F420-dependent oxidoreductase